MAEMQIPEVAHSMFRGMSVCIVNVMSFTVLFLKYSDLYLNSTIVLLTSTYNSIQHLHAAQCDFTHPELDILEGNPVQLARQYDVQRAYDKEQRLSTTLLIIKETSELSK